VTRPPSARHFATRKAVKRPRKRRALHPRRPWEPAFLRAYARGGIVTEGCRAARIDRATAYRRREADPGFAKAMDDAYEEAADRLERRALDSPEPVLKIFMLKGMRPEKYRERFEHSGRIDSADVTDPEARDRRLTELLAAAMSRKAAGDTPAGDVEVATVPVGLVGQRA
jgi:hypothetical protein